MTLRSSLTWRNSERKIDDIARDIDGIKLLLEGLDRPKESLATIAATQLSQDGLTKLPSVGSESSELVNSPQWDHSVHVIDFIKAVVENNASDTEPESRQVVSSLKNLVNSLENPEPAYGLSDMKMQATNTSTSSLPSIDAVVKVMQWARGTPLLRPVFAKIDVVRSPPALYTN